MAKQIQIFHRMSEWPRVWHMPILKENIRLSLTKDQWVTIIILNNSNVPKMRKEKHFKRPRLKENGTKGCREQKLESHSKPIPPELTNLPRWDHKSM